MYFPGHATTDVIRRKDQTWTSIWLSNLLRLEVRATGRKGTV